MVLTIRDANEEDSEDIWNWRNDSVTRQNSRNKEEIPWENHVGWYVKALLNQNKKIFVGMDGETKVGRIMFDIIEGGLSEVGVVIAPEGRGRGYGSELIRIGSLEYFSREESINEILAEIQRNNPASIRVFEKAGYVKRENYKRYGEEKDAKYF
ncbi:MAG: GNAT family N-acetyltransferase, partial [Nanoarchaeota archaeon]|nr:GNAT family N-acetyltransferase [Nanoarchaeota archaeon]